MSETNNQENNAATRRSATNNYQPMLNISSYCFVFDFLDVMLLGFLCLFRGCEKDCYCSGNSHVVHRLRTTHERVARATVLNMFFSAIFLVCT